MSCGVRLIRKVNCKQRRKSKSPTYCQHWPPRLQHTILIKSDLRHFELYPWFTHRKGKYYFRVNKKHTQGVMSRIFFRATEFTSYFPTSICLSFIAYCIFRLLAISIQSGKLNMSQTLSDWSCNSGCSPPQDCRLRSCTNIAFTVAFSGSGKVRAQGHPTWFKPPRSLTRK